MLYGRDFNYQFLKLDFKRQLDFSVSENIVWSTQHHSHKSDNKNKSNVPTPEQRNLIKPPSEEMDFAAKSSPLARTSPPPAQWGLPW